MAEIDSSVWECLLTAAHQARANAHAPYSTFRVGAAIWTDAGQLAAGCNVENVSFPCGQCAEAGAVASLTARCGAPMIRAVVVMGAADRFTWPCGQCRQILAEFAAADAQVMSVAGDARSEPVRLDALLPHAFRTIETDASAGGVNT